MAAIRRTFKTIQMTNKPVFISDHNFILEYYGCLLKYGGYNKIVMEYISNKYIIKFKKVVC